MNFTEVLVEALKNGSLMMVNCQINIDNQGTIGDFNSQEAPASKKPIDDSQDLNPKLKSEKAKTLLKRLVDNQYCHVQGSCYVWDGKQADYGYMVYVMSDTLGIRHPSSDRIQWKDFHPLFLNAREMEPVAKVAVSNDISPFGNSRAWNNVAKKVKNILTL